jgi:phosphoglycolate phosphatase-like HAD superfamily hydrolase
VSLLVLWDVDHTLLDAGGAGIQLIRRAFSEMFGRDFPPTPALAGRTDRAIQLEVLTRSGVPDPQAELPAFQRLVVGLAPQLGGLVRESGRALPGATEALTAVAALADGRGGPDHRGPNYRGPLVQSVLTGNMQATAVAKLAALDLDRFLDLRVGAYGDAHEIRADLVPLARARAAAAYGGDFAGRATVLIGDTPLDIEAAQLAGARSIGVATGGFSPAELAAAGADTVLPDLTDTARVLAAIVPSPAGTLPSGDV